MLSQMGQRSGNYFMAAKSSGGWWKWILIVAVIAAGVGGFFYFRHGRTPPVSYNKAAVEQSTADLANAKANLELQQVEANRSSDLFTNKLISGSDHDTAIATLHEAEASVKIKQASLNNALVNLNYCKILSPVDGVVILR